MIENELLEALSRRSWRGNVRELRNVAERMTLLRKGNVLRAADLPPEDAPIGIGTSPTWTLTPGNIQLPAEGAALEDIERSVIVYALERHGGNISAAARFLRAPRHILVYRLQKFGLSRRPPDVPPE